MPTYVYKCDACGTQFEQFQSFKDEPLKICPSCSGTVRRVLQPVGIVFKGSGWYITDSRKSSTATVNANGDDATKPADTTTEPAGETKAEPKTDAPAADTPSSTPSPPASTPAA